MLNHKIIGIRFNLQCMIDVTYSMRDVCQAMSVVCVCVYVHCNLKCVTHSSGKLKTCMTTTVRDSSALNIFSS